MLTYAWSIFGTFRWVALGSTTVAININNISFRMPCFSQKHASSKQLRWAHHVEDGLFKIMREWAQCNDKSVCPT